MTTKPPFAVTKFIRRNTRKKKEILKLVEEGVIDNYEDYNIGTLAVSMEFEDKSSTQVS